MPDSPMQIGSISLQNFEVPSSLRFGGGYRLTIHRLASGQRIVERLGPDDSEISFQGIFSGADAESRVRSINSLRLSGQAVWLTWKSFRFKIIIKTFYPNYHSPWWIPYEICCTVVDQAGVDSLESSILTAQISTDLGTALTLLSFSNIQLPALQVALTAKNVTVAGTADQAHAISLVQDSLNKINYKIDSCSTILEGSLNASNVSSHAAAFATAVTSAGSLAAAVNAKSYVGRISSSLSNPEV